MIFIYVYLRYNAMKLTYYTEKVVITIGIVYDTIVLLLRNIVGCENRLRLNVRTCSPGRWAMIKKF